MLLNSRGYRKWTFSTT